METPAAKYRPPQQDRSRRALEKILAAAADVLAARGMDDFTMTAVADKAKVSIGAIYRRFAGKDQLLAAVNERLLVRMERALGSALTAADPTLAGIVQALVSASVDDLSSNPGFPDLYGPGNALTPRVHEAIATRRRLFLEAVEPHLAEVHHDDARVAVSMVQAMVTGACVHRASQGPGVEDGLSWAQFATQLDQMAMSYLLASAPALVR